MPTYQYKCLTCATEFDRLNVPVDERDEQRCETCDSPLKRVIVFKGMTWAPTAGGYR